jgi:hypothetical protein
VVSGIRVVGIAAGSGHRIFDTSSTAVTLCGTSRQKGGLQNKNLIDQIKLKKMLALCPNNR